MFLTKILPKYTYKPTQNLNIKFDLFDLATLDDLDLTKGHKSLRRVLISIPDKIHAALSTLFQSDMAALQGESNNDRL